LTIVRVRGRGRVRDRVRNGVRVRARISVRVRVRVRVRRRARPSSGWRPAGARGVRWVPVWEAQWLSLSPVGSPVSFHSAGRPPASASLGQMAERLWLAGLVLDIGGCLGAILGGHAHLARLGRAQGSERKARLEARAKVMARVMAKAMLGPGLGLGWAYSPGS